MLVCSVARCRTALALAAFATGCSQSPQPVSPDQTPPSTEASDSPASETPETQASPSTEGSATAPSDPVAAADPAATASATTRSAKDTRGKEQIQQVMAANRDKVRACYDAALAQNPGIKGALVVDFLIDPNGKVKQAEVNWSESDLHIPELDTCAVDAVRAIQFPASSRGLESKVTYPFNFNPPRPSPPAPREEPLGPAR